MGCTAWCAGVIARRDHGTWPNESAFGALKGLRGSSGTQLRPLSLLTSVFWEAAPGEPLSETVLGTAA
ncbi:hypothetical protein COCON_G00230900 [Conger conger]|uniref:Uncharacterized protein n=1 Tax=Conger conger TaxID=82655 RepID=A0A9Q1HN19_CONCO|nr:hypothetical protein COCON_G00230900 [Conger conger]